MTVRIEGARLAPGQTPEQTPPAAFAASSPEAVIAEAALALEESAERAREGERAQRQVRSQARRAEIQARKKAARLELAATVIQSAGKAASGVIGASSSGGSAERAQGYAALAQAEGELGGGIARFFGAKASAAAETHRLSADEAADRLAEHRDSREQLSRLTERAVDHVAQIIDAQHQAAMAALRG